ncbi:MAG: urease accessory protein UreE [Rhodoplanes sp.]
MRRASVIRKAGEWEAAAAIDAVLLDADERHRRRIVLTGEKGTRFVLDLPKAISLQHGDGLVLDDGTIVRVEGKPEPLIEVSAADASALARLSWHLGNRHTEMQIVGEKLRIRRDHVLEEMLKNLGATLHPLDAVFEPERGAYGHEHSHDHGHSHGHGHDNDHDHG